MFEQAFRNIDDVLRKEAGCTTELDYTEQTSWLLFLKYLDGLEQDRAGAQAERTMRGHTARRVIAGWQPIPWCLIVCLVGLACSRSGMSSKSSSGRVGADGAVGPELGGTSVVESAGATGDRGGAGGKDGGSGGTAGSDVKTTGGTAADAAAPAAGISATSSARAGSGGQATGGGPDARFDVGSAGAPGTLDAGSSGPSPDASGKHVGNITTREKADPSGLVFSEHWDALTPENAGFWGAVQRTPGGAFNWSSLDALYQYAEQKGIAFAEHCFIYGAFQPGPSTSTIGEADVQAWMRAFCERYPKTKTIEVVSEPPPHTTPPYANNIGGGTNGDWKWITNAFTWARQACPDAVLILSDYNLVEKADENQRFIGIVNTIKAAGAPIDAVGVELFNSSTSPLATTVKPLLDKLRTDTGLPIYVTAYSVDRKDDAQQLQIYQSQFPMFWQAEYIRGITLWGWIYDEGSSLPYSGLVRAGTSRPAMKWLMDWLGRSSP